MIDRARPGRGPTTTPAIRLVRDAIRTRSLCCRCLVSATGLSDVMVRSSLLTASRGWRLDTWAPCESCGAVDETYRFLGDVGGVPEQAPFDRIVKD